MENKLKERDDIAELKKKCELLRKKIRESILFLSEHVVFTECSENQDSAITLDEDIIKIDDGDFDEEP